MPPAPSGATISWTPRRVPGISGIEVVYVDLRAALGDVTGDVFGLGAHPFGDAGESGGGMAPTATSSPNQRSNPIPR
jgi:hypothetical protein